MPKVTLYKGFIIIDPDCDQLLYNKLCESTFLSKHPSGDKFYCMANNMGLKFIKKYKKFFENNFTLDSSVKELLEKDKIKYVEEHEVKLSIPKFDLIEWKEHQLKALGLIKKYKQFCIFLGPGTGKTLIALGAISMIDEAYNDGNKEYLVVTPKKAIPQYSKEIEKYISPDIHITVTNYESLSKVTNKKYKAMILDESHKAKNVSSQINKTLCSIDAECTYLFTGTPQDKKRDEVFAQLKILNKDLLTVKYLFYGRFFELDDYYKPIKEKHSDELEEIISKCSYGDKTENLIDLPSEEEKVMLSELGPLKDIYKKFKKDRSLVMDGWMSLGDNGAKLRTKLTQICSGFIIDEKGISHRLNYNPKEEGLKNLLVKCNQAIIYTTYNEEQKIVEEILKSEHRRYVIVNGQTKDTKESLEKFRDGEVDYLVIQIVSGNAALDFPNINNVIYYSLHDSYIYFEQSKYRIRRIGQKRTCNYFYLIVKGTVEVSRLRSLKNKKSFNNQEFELYRKE